MIPGTFQLNQASQLEAQQRFFCVISDGTVEELAALLADGADPNCEDEYGSPALREALLEPEMVRLLIEAGASVQVRFEGFLGEQCLEDLSLAESICDDCHDFEDQRDFGATYQQSLKMILEAGADATVRAPNVPAVLADIFSEHSRAIAKGK